METQPVTLAGKTADELAQFVQIGRGARRRKRAGGRVCHGLGVGSDVVVLPCCRPGTLSPTHTNRPARLICDRLEVAAMMHNASIHLTPVDEMGSRKHATF
ncbi:hypothetical protein GWL_00300 [Herbaspirillum sp. GW103]|nr:hypothetical protein GWL_00300 [Herbaspirillum sp. GW103]